MNVLQINTVYPNGSTGRIVAEIAEYTARQPADRALVAFGIGAEERDGTLSAIRIGKPWERKLHGAIRKLFDAEGYGSYFATGKLIQFCDDNRPDVIHMHNLHGCYLNLSRWFRYLTRKNIPVIWTLHDCWPLTGHCAHFSYVGCQKWKTLCSHCPQKGAYPACIGIDGSSRNYRLKRKLFTALGNLTIVTPCRWLEDIVEESYLQNTPVRVIYNGVNTKRFKPVESSLRVQYRLEDRNVLLAVASVWSDRKGLRELIQLSQVLDDSYRIVIIGLTKEQLKTLPDNMLGLEQTQSPDLLCQWYTAANCFVNPTLEDTMPLVNLEAMACGTPVAVFDTGGCPEVITDACGLVVAKGDIQGLANAVKQICHSSENYTKACTEQAKRFSIESTVHAYHDLYQEVLR